MAQTIIIESFGGPENFKLVDREVGTPGPGQIRIRHHAAGLNFIDVYQRTGLYPIQKFQCNLLTPVAPVPIYLGSNTPPVDIP